MTYQRPYQKIIEDISQAKRGSYLAVFVIMFTVFAGIGAHMVTQSEAVALTIIGLAGLGIVKTLIESHKK